MNQHICLIEDDEIIGEALVERFEEEHIKCVWFRDGMSALRALRTNTYGVVISDINLPDITGEELFSRLLEKIANLPPFLFITGYGSIDQAVRLLKMGARDYLTKPFDVGELISMVQLILPPPGHEEHEPHTLGVSTSMIAIEGMLEKLSVSDSAVLISGESGVGKEYAARFLHRGFSAGESIPFIAVNCGAIPENLLEAELFGYEKGSFTGAVHARRGLFEQAHGGTLFLDEIGDMPLPMQVKLLRAIQERSIQRIGSEKNIEIDIHLVCASHRNLEEMVKSGDFREDLYYRINVINIPIPPLRERKDDILWFANMFLAEFSELQGKENLSFHSKTEQAMMSYPWPGNIRELRNCMERACVLCSVPVIMPEALFGDAWRDRLSGYLGVGGETLGEYIQQCERDYIAQALEDNENRISDTAGMLGISRKTLWDKMRKLDLKG